MIKDNTIPKLLKKNYERYGDTKVLMREKTFGIWQPYTWKDCYEKVKYFSLGLMSLGLEPEGKVSIIGENKPQWYWAELAIQSAKGIVAGIFTDCMPDEVKFFVSHTDSVFVVARDQEQVDKLLQVKEELPLVKKIIYWDAKGLWNYDDPILMSFDEVVESGKEFEESHPGLFEKTVEEGKGDDIAFICFTSGTTSLPKAAMLPHHAMISIAKDWQGIEQWRDTDQYVSFLPPAWGLEQFLGCIGSLLSGMEVNFPEEPETVQENIREIGPQILFWGPRNWESTNRLIQAKMGDSSRFRRSLYHLFLPVGYKVADMRAAKQKVNLLWRFLYKIGYWAMFHQLRDKLGLLGVSHAYTAGAAISPEIIRYFQAIGVNIKQLYGTTEGGMVTLHRDGDVKPETCGTPFPGAQIMLTEEGEILLRGEGFFAGYYKDPETTAEMVKGGWFHTGDFGYFDDDNHLVVMDRMADLTELKGGQKFSPQYIETRLRFSPYVKDAVAIGGGDRDFVSCLVNIDIENVGRWAEANRIVYTTFTDLSQKPEVLQLIREDIMRVNNSIPDWMRVQRFVSLHREFDPDEAELTRTRKLRRGFIEERFKELLGALYGQVDELVVEAPVTYRDGRKGVIKTAIKINDVAKDKE